MVTEFLLEVMKKFLRWWLHHVVGVVMPLDHML